MVPRTVPLGRVISVGPQFRISIVACPCVSGVTSPGPPETRGCSGLAISTRIFVLVRGFVPWLVMRLARTVQTENGGR